MSCAKRQRSWLGTWTRWVWVGEGEWVGGWVLERGAMAHVQQHVVGGWLARCRAPSQTCAIGAHAAGRAPQSPGTAQGPHEA